MDFNPERLFGTYRRHAPAFSEENISSSERIRTADRNRDCRLGNFAFEVALAIGTRFARPDGALGLTPRLTSAA
jgi:hypothetical protein